MNHVQSIIHQNSFDNFIKYVPELTGLFNSLRLQNIEISACLFDKSYFDLDIFRCFNIDLPIGIQKSVTKRQAEFLAGRIMAQQTLAQLGSETLSVAIGKNRSPIWPSNIIGSISHNDNIALCIAGERCEYTYLGCDVESLIENRTQLNICDAIINPIEKQLMLSCSLDKHMFITLAFSAKESLFKALYPSVKRYFYFRAAQIYDIETKNQTFKIKLLETLTDSLSRNTIFNGFYIFNENYIATFIVQ